MRGPGLAALLTSGLLLAACGQDDKPAPAAAPSGSAPSSATVPVATTGDPSKGQQIWIGQCVACHNSNPAKDGPIGPAVKGASKDLLEARVVHGTYPPGYKPKRESKVMPPRPDLVESIPDLAAYLR